MEFLSLPGQERTRRRDEFLGGLLNYYLGPTGIPERLGLMDMMNPVSDVGRAMTSSQEMLAPGRRPEERASAGLSMLTDIASVAAPGVATRMAGGDEAAAVAESLLGFGGQTRQGLDEATRRFLADESGALTLPGRAVGPAEERGRQIVNMLTSGRAGDITEDMLDLGDPVLNTRLNQYLFENYDLPMDEASRMARAQERFDTDAFHATRAADGFQVFRPGVRGSTYFAATPEQAVRGAVSQSLEFGGQGGNVSAVMPVMVNSQDVQRLGINPEAWSLLPERVVGEDAIRAVQPQIAQTGARYWDDAYEHAMFGDEVRYFRNDPPMISYQDLEPGTDVFGYRLPGFNSGSDVSSLERAAQNGYRGFMVSDEAGSSIVAGPDMPVRSRFARFDPRLAHLRNLSAGVGGLGLLAIPQEEQ
jgi:hypothetical protein